MIPIDDIGLPDIMRRRKNTTDRGQGQTNTEESAETATPNHLADDMYTSPTQLYITTQHQPQLTYQLQPS